MARYGLHFGTAFQLVDDVLDYSARSDDIGKNVGDDLAEGKPTLPLIQALVEATPAQREFQLERGGQNTLGMPWNTTELGEIATTPAT